MRDYHGPEYPLDGAAFRHAIAVGLGRAPVHVRRHGTEQVRGEIWEAATSCKVYDPQVEGLPVTWLAELCLAANIVPRVITEPPKGSHWDRQLRCALLKEFASRGYLAARTALYAECEQVEGSGDVYGSWEIVELDGEAGLLFVARKLGELATTLPEGCVDDSAIRDFDALRGEGTGLSVLRSHADTDRAIAAYLEAVATSLARQREQREKHRNKQRPSAREVVAQISSAERSLYWLLQWGRKASPEELGHILGLLEARSSPRILENALRCLSGSRTPPVHAAMFELLHHEDADVREFAARSLAPSVEPRIRAEGLGALPHDVSVALALLRKNARAEDVPALLEALAPVSDVDLQHSIVSDAVDLLEENESVREPRLALYIYEASPCRRCRGKAVNLLLEWDACPPWLRDEGVFDASPGIRAALSQP